jgi:hypothetical protein
MNINPQSTLRIVRQLSDPSDSGTYYVQAVVRNSATGAALQTINLTDEGDQRFTSSYQTPADVSGNGFYIDITTTVYTDAGYTTVSTDYSRDTQTYHVQQAWNHAMGIGGGMDVNYDKVRRIIKEELAAQEKLEIPESKDLTPEMLGMERRIKDAVSQAVASIRFPEQVQPDLDRVINEVRSTIEQAVNATLMSIESKEVTPLTDLTPIAQQIQQLPFDELQQKLDEAVQTIQSFQDFAALKDATEEFMARIPKRAQNTNLQRPNPQEGMALRARKLMGI